MAVTRYRQIGKGKSRRYKKVNLGKGRRPADLTGPTSCGTRSLTGTRPWEHVGDDLDEVIAARAAEAVAPFSPERQEKK